MGRLTSAIRFQEIANPADTINMDRGPLSWRDRLTLVAEEISLGVTLLELARTERQLDDTAASHNSLKSSQSACNSARYSLGKLSCVIHSHRQTLEGSIGKLQSAISEFLAEDEAAGRTSVATSVISNREEYRSRR
jgi:hypothetical protein